MSIQVDAKRFSDSNTDFGSSSDIVSSESDDEFYKTGYENAGVVIIFTQKEYINAPSKTRHGADKDEENLKRAFGRCGFDVQSYRDYTTEMIENKLKEVARNDHSKNSALIVVMMSHGGKDENDNEGIIYTHDGKMKVDSLWRYFAADRCPSLVGKPKLFFIQACRGTMSDFGAHMEEDDKRFSKLYENTRRSKSTPIPQKIPIMADILVMFSSADTYESYRHSEDGSWFIEALCKKLEQCLSSSQEKDLITILTSVNRYVAFLKENRYNEHVSFKQMPVIMSMLTKTYIFDKKFFK